MNENKSGFSLEWDKFYFENNGSKWPWTDLVSLYSNIFKNSEIDDPLILELGFGTGANIPFFLENNIKYYGIEGSKNGYLKALKNFPSIKENLINADFTEDLSFLNKRFDLIFDRASVIHNDNNSIKKIIDNINYLLNENGYFIGIDWFGKEHIEYKNNSIEVDNSTRIFKEDSNFKGLGKVNFVNESDILSFFKDFEFIHFKKKVIKDLLNKNDLVFYDFVIKK